MVSATTNAPLHYWIYRSRAKVPALSADSTLIYLQSRNRNAADGLSGYLHRENDRFLQYVEGPAEAVERLKIAIRADPRHDGIQEIAGGQVRSRRFAGWDMAFTEVERNLYRLFQVRHGRDPRIEAATEADILAFMDDAIRTGRAANVRDTLPQADAG